MTTVIEALRAEATQRHVFINGDELMMIKRDHQAALATYTAKTEEVSMSPWISQLAAGAAWWPTIKTIWGNDK